MPQSLAQVWLHVIFSTKERRPFLNDESFQMEMFRMLAHHVKETGCVSASVGGHIDHVVDTYIRNQREHHHKLSFQVEFRELCQRHEIEIDERYVWD
jgi:hypothetical protein